MSDWWRDGWAAGGTGAAMTVPAMAARKEMNASFIL